MTATRTPRGLYAITSDALCRDAAALTQGVRAALQGGAVMIQYRDKRATASQRLSRAEALCALCHDQGVPFIVNDDIDLARAIGADGVHLGRSDGTVDAARQALGAHAIVGISCGPHPERALQAETEGASYAAIGRLFPSSTKPDAPAAEIDDLRAARAAIGIRLCAIGGITPAHAPAVIAVGADLLAVVAGVFDAPDVTSAAGAYTAAFQRPTEKTQEP
ncbi:thiamine phosphate synthase [Algiphilus sp.]|uniref:thiamine phosphate synthase n=1 Tax=Algiphilus sp. TaxID=1872431 RepID=UPI003BA8BFDC